MVDKCVRPNCFKPSNSEVMVGLISQDVFFHHEYLKVAYSEKEIFPNKFPQKWYINNNGIGGIVGIGSQKIKYNTRKYKL